MGTVETTFKCNLFKKNNLMGDLHRKYRNIVKHAVIFPIMTQWYEKLLFWIPV